VAHLSRKKAQKAENLFEKPFVPFGLFCGYAFCAFLWLNKRPSNRLFKNRQS
jgi:hypothetical protein